MISAPAVFRKSSSFDDRVTYRCGNCTRNFDGTRRCVYTFDCYVCLLEHERNVHDMHAGRDSSRESCTYGWCYTLEFNYWERGRSCDLHEHFEDLRAGHACCNPLESHCEFINDGLQKTHCGSVSMGTHNRYVMMIGLRKSMQDVVDGEDEQENLDERIAKIRGEIGPCERTMFEDLVEDLTTMEEVESAGKRR